MTKTKSSKGRANKRSNKNPKPKSQPEQKKAKLIDNSRNADADDPILFDPSTSSYEPSHAPAPVPAPESESDSDTPSSPTRIHTLLEPYSKDQLMSFLLDAAGSDPSLRARIRTAADSDISHRKIFVHGLSWDTTNADLLEAMSPFGPTEACNVVTDHVTGRAKGFGFVIFKTRSSATKALKVPQKRIKSRFASFQLASMGPAANPSLVSAAAPTPVPVAEERRVYVSNVHADTPPDQLKTLFAQFGEIEAGPVGFDKITGKSRGYAIFVYKNQESARRALEEPYKMFEGQQLHCRLYTPSNKAKAATFMPSAVQTPPPPQQQQQQQMYTQPTQQSVLAAMAAAQNLALLGQNPAYSMLLAQNPLLAAAMMQQAYGGGIGMGGPTAGGGGAQSVLGTYGQGSAAGLQGFPGANTQPGMGMQGFPGTNTQPGSGNSGSMFGGFPSSFM